MSTTSRKVTKSASAQAVGKAIGRSSGNIKVARSALTGSFAVKKNSGKSK